MSKKPASSLRSSSGTPLITARPLPEGSPPHRQPRYQCARTGRKPRRFAHPKQETRDSQRSRTGGKPSCGGKHLKPCHGTHHHDPAPKPICHPATWRLKQSIGPVERGNAPAHSDLTDMELSHDRRGGYADSPALHIHHEGHQETQGQDVVPDVRGPITGRRPRTGVRAALASAVLG